MKCFLHFILTGEDTDVDVDSLIDDRLLLRRQTIERISELKIGDHIERPLKNLKYHHMFVLKLQDDSSTNVKVIHFDGKVKELDEDVFETGKVNRIIYPERYSLDDGYQILTETMKKVHIHVHSKSLFFNLSFFFSFLGKRI